LEEKKIKNMTYTKDDLIKTAKTWCDCANMTFEDFYIKYPNHKKGEPNPNVEWYPEGFKKSKYKIKF
jgi:hypothetical protein